MWIYFTTNITEPWLACEASTKYDIITMNLNQSLHVNMTLAQAVRLSNELQAAIREFDNE